MTPKKMIKMLLPYGLVRLLTKTKKASPAQYGWFGDYARLSDAQAETKGYDQPNILEDTLKKHLAMKSTPPVIETFRYPVLSALLKSAAAGQLDVVDFGGSLGSSYFQNRGMLSHIEQLRWCVVEQEHYVKAGQQQLADEQLKFAFTIEEALQHQKAQFLLLSSVLPYLDDPYGFCAELLKHRFETILLDRTFFNPAGTTRYTVQHVPPTIYEASYASILLSEEQLLAIFSPHYEVVTTWFSQIDNNGKLPVYNPDGMFDCKGYWLKLKDK